MSDFQNGAKRTRSRRGAALALNVSSLALGLLFTAAGVGKFLHPGVAESCARLGLPDWFRVLFGAAEIGGGLLLLVPRTGTYGAFLLGIVIATGVATHALVGGGRSLVPALVLLALLTLIGYARRPWAAAQARFMAALDTYAEREIARERHRRLFADLPLED